jgi:hypothetical protein
MAYEQRPNSGQLFKNRERKNEKHPNLKGTGLLELADGTLVQLEIAAWTKESPNAGRWLSLTIRQKGAVRQTRQSNGRQHFNDYVNQHGTALDGQGVPPDDKDIPFLVNIDVSPERHLPRA